MTAPFRCGFLMSGSKEKFSYMKTLSVKNVRKP